MSEMGIKYEGELVFGDRLEFDQQISEKEKKEL